MPYRRRIGVIAGLVLLGMLVAALVLRPGPGPEPSGTLIVMATAADQRVIRFLTLPGGAFRQIDLPPYNSFEPRWSPDGSQLAYSHRGPEDASAGIYVAAADGSAPRLITAPPPDGYDSFFEWSPDGTQIVFTRTRSPFSALYIVDVASGEERALTDYTNDLHPDWSPDGTRIVFTTSRDGFQELYTVRPDGSDLTRLTVNENLNDLRGQWSPDGSQIAYLTNYSVGDGTSEVHVMRADGSASRQITTDDRDDQRPIWSPDGRYLVFVTRYSDPDSLDLTVYDLETDTLRRVTDDPANDFDPHWSPDSAWIAFQSRREGAEGIYLIRPDGSEEHPLSSEPAYRGTALLAWRP